MMNLRSLLILFFVIGGILLVRLTPAHATPSDTVTNVVVGGSPDGVIVDTATGNVYVTDIISNNVSIISGSSNAVIGTVQVQTSSGGGTFDSSNREVYVTNSASNTVSVINDTSNKVVSTITVGSQPGRAVFDSSNQEVYVSNFGQNSVSVINGRNNTVVTSLPVGNGPAGLAFDPNNNEIYVADFGSNAVTIINGSTNTLIGTIGVGNGADGAAFDSTNGDVYISNYYSNSVTVILGSTNTILSTVSVGSSPEYLAYASNNNEVYVTNRFSNTVSVIFTNSQTLAETIGVGPNPRGIGFNPPNDEIYVANNSAGTVSIFLAVVPTLQLTPATGVVGTKVTVQGTGIPSQAVEVTFDDAFIGTTLVRNASFSFTLDVPVSQVGLHQIKAVDPFGNVVAGSSFTVTPAGPPSLAVTVTVGLIYFPGDTVVASILVAANGVPLSSSGLLLHVNLTRPDNSIVVLNVTSIGNGLFRSTVPLTKTAQVGSYSLLALAHLPTMISGSSLATFEVKLPWLSSQGTTAAIAGVSTVGVAGIAIMTWQKGLFKRRHKNRF